ncbi:MAG: RNA pseudouridine synthase [Moraxellaceae bacterium]|nr:RNA pseudouridine synthase [Moraxellaceae bacterium]
MTGACGTLPALSAARPEIAMTEPIRLSRRVTEQFACSRREAELYIEGGWVTVDGVVVEAPQHMVSTETVALLPGARPEPLPPVTVLLHKPAGIDDDRDGAQPAQALLRADTRSASDRSGLRLLQRHLQRLRTTVPLETAASGLLVFTQDIGVWRRLVEEGDRLEHEVIVTVAEAVTPDMLARLNQRMTHGGFALPAAKVSLQSEQRLRFALKGAAPGQIAWMCEETGLTVTAMKRLRLGALPLAALAPGEWRFLAAGERF